MTKSIQPGHCSGFKLKPAANGKLTKITFTVDGIVVGSKSVKAQ
ncbi:MAG: hypothetical protein QOE75_2782 [Solirubrobacterales bacterium]|nr:hypothetical protein [Solirubrobacterales bacterium]